MDNLRTRMDWKTALNAQRDNLLEDEMQAERASALGAAGRRLERALARLKADDSGEAELVAASRVAWEFMVLREAAGLRDWPAVVLIYSIPKAVQSRMGVAPRSPTLSSRK